MTRTKTHTDALFDELLQGCDSPEDLFGKHGLLKSLTKRVVEHALRAELTEHLGYEPHAPEGRGSGNARNGSSAKTVQTAHGDLPLQVPREREGSFAPVLVPKRQRRLEGFDEKVLALYARGLTTREIQRTPGRTLRGGSLAYADFDDHGCGVGGCAHLAEPAVGGGVSHPVF